MRSLLAAIVAVLCVGSGVNWVGVEASVRTSRTCGNSSEALRLCGPLVSGVYQALPQVSVSPGDIVSSENLTKTLTGFDVELVKDIMVRAGYTNYYVNLTATYEEALHLVETDYCDVATAQYTITAFREGCQCEFGAPPEYRQCCLDFTHPLQNSGVSLLVPKTLMAGETTTVFEVVVSNELLNSYALIMLLLIVSGHIQYFLERSSNPVMFPPSYLSGIDHAIWWSAATVTTVGYGDKVPRSRKGRVFGFCWMFVGIILISTVTGVITSRLTTASIREPVNSLSQIHGKRLCTIHTYANMQEIRKSGVKLHATDSIESCYRSIESGTDDAVLYDTNELQYFLRTTGNANLRVTPDVLSIGLAYAMSEFSTCDILSKLNPAILAARESGYVVELVNQWFGATAASQESIVEEEELNWPLAITTITVVSVYVILWYIPVVAKFVARRPGCPARLHTCSKFVLRRAYELHANEGDEVRAARALKESKALAAELARKEREASGKGMTSNPMKKIGGMSLTTTARIMASMKAAKAKARLRTKDAKKVAAMELVDQLRTLQRDLKFVRSDIKSVAAERAGVLDDEAS